MNKNYRDLIIQSFEVRKARNPSYSLRAFARDLGLSATRVSDILRKKQGLSAELAARIGAKMGFDPKMQELFTTLVDAEHARSRTAKELAKKKLKELESNKDFEIDLDLFKVISDWQHMAILEVLRQPEAKSDPEWIARKLKLSKEEAAVSIKRLIDVGLIKAQGKTLKATDNFVKTTDGVRSLAIQKYHGQILQKAVAALEVQDVQDRDFSVLSFNVTRSQIPEAKKLINEFRKTFLKKIENKNQGEEAYCLAVQLFSLEK